MSNPTLELMPVPKPTEELDEEGYLVCTGGSDQFGCQDLNCGLWESAEDFINAENERVEFYS